MVLVLLFIADKTQLNNNPGQRVGGAEVSETIMKLPDDSSRDLMDRIPSVSGIKGADSLQNVARQAADENQKSVTFKALVALLRDNGRYDAAAVCAGKIASLEPSSQNEVVAGALFRNAAAVFESKGDTALANAFFDQAVVFLSKTLEREPQNEDALIEIGLAYIESGVPGKSMEGIQKLLRVMEINPKNEEAAFRLGLFSRQTGQFDKAATRFETVRSLNPQNLAATWYLALTYLDLGKTTDAMPLLTELAAQTTDQELAASANEILNSFKN